MFFFFFFGQVNSFFFCINVLYGSFLPVFFMAKTIPNEYTERGVDFFIDLE